MRKKRREDSDSGSDSDFMTEDDNDLRGTIKDDDYTYKQSGID